MVDDLSLVSVWLRCRGGAGFLRGVNMADVKWIKMSTGLPDNRKIKQIRNLPNGDSIALMWVFMLCLAGSVNEQGLIYITPEVPYTDEMLAEEFNMELNTVRLGLATFQRFGMIEIVEDVIFLSAWEKWQSVDKLSELREYNRIAKQKSRAKQKLLADVNDMSMTSQRCQDTDKIRREEDKDIKKERKKASYDEILTMVEDDFLRDLYVDYIKMRKMIKAPMTDRALKMLIDKVKKLEPNNIENQKKLLENAIINNWKSVYPLKDDEKGNQNGSNCKSIKQNRLGYVFEDDDI